MSKAELHSTLMVPPSTCVLKATIPKTSLASFIRACKATAQAYPRREEDTARFNSAVLDSCQLMTADTRVPYGTFQSRFEEYCDRMDAKWSENLLSQASLAEHNVKHILENGNAYIFGFQWVDPIAEAPVAIDYEKLSVASAQAFQAEYESGLVEQVA